MKEALNFVKGAVPKTDFVPALNHYYIAGGRIMSFNGTVALSHPIDLDIEVMPESHGFFHAITKIGDDTLRIDVTPSGRLSVKTKKFKALINCLNSSAHFTDILPMGQKIPVPAGLGDVIKQISPFIGSDPHNPVFAGVCISPKACYASDRKIVIKRFFNIPQLEREIILPDLAVKEIARIGLNPVHMSLDKNSVTFYYDNGAWLKTVLIDASLPDFERIIYTKTTHDYISFAPDFQEGFDRISPFCETYIFVDGFTIGNALDNDAVTASYEISASMRKFSTSVAHLREILKVATEIDTTSDPYTFHAENLIGVVTPFK